MARETEIKLVVDRPRFDRTARQFGFTCLQERTWEENLLWDFPDRRLTRAGQLLRLRVYGSQVVLTWKGPMREEVPYKERDEIEVRVDAFDATYAILERLGFSVWFRYQKYRTVYRWDGVKIAYDETPIGDYVEVEGEPADLERAIQHWGWSDCPRLRVTYYDLFREARDQGRIRGDHMVFPAAGGTGCMS